MKSIVYPPAIQRAIAAGAAVIIGDSGGKDSQATKIALARQRDYEGWTNEVRAVHCNLGEDVEWPESLPMCRKTSQVTNIPLQVVMRPQGDLIEQIKERAIKLEGTDKPFWPSSSARYCTAGQNRDQIDKVLRQYPLVISVAGIRADESTERCERIDERGVVSVRPAVSASWLYTEENGKRRPYAPDVAIEMWLERRDQQLGLFDDISSDIGRLVLDWYPLADWTLDDVWEACGTSQEELNQRRKVYAYGEDLLVKGQPKLAAVYFREALDGWPCHPCYVYGNTRCSCMFCVLGSIGDHRTAAKHHPEALARLVDLEQEYGSLFKKNYSIAQFEGMRLNYKETSQ